MDFNEQYGDLLKFTGIEAESFDDFKSKFSERFFTEKQVFDNQELLKKFTGVTLGKVQDNIDKIAKANGVVLSDEERKAMKIEDFVGKVFDLKEVEFQESMKKTKELASKGADEKYQEMQDLNEKLKSKITDLEDLNKSTVQKYESEIEGWNGKLKDFKRNTATSQIFSQVKFDPEADELRREGFISKAKERYAIDLDENDTPIIRDRESGKRIENPDKHGEYMGAVDVLNNFAIEKGVGAKNPRTNERAPQPPPGPNPPRVEPRVEQRQPVQRRIAGGAIVK